MNDVDQEPNINQSQYPNNVNNQLESQINGLKMDGLDQDYMGNTLLGRSNFAVIKGRLGWEKMAIKVIPYRDHHLPRDIVIREMHSLHVCSGGRNIINFIGWQEVVEDGMIYMAMEHCEGGTLTAWINKDVQRSLEELFMMVKGIISGVAFVHFKGLIHNDIKPDNVLLRGGKNGAASFEPLISDFGSATPPGQPFNGTLGYICPESYNDPPDTPNRRPIADEKSDTFALGVTIYQMYTGKFRRILDYSGFDLSNVGNIGVREILNEILCPRQNRMTVRQILEEFPTASSGFDFVAATSSTPPPPQERQRQLQNEQQLLLLLREPKPARPVRTGSGSRRHSSSNQVMPQQAPLPSSSSSSRGSSRKAVGPSKLERFPLIKQFWGKNIGESNDAIPIDIFIKDNFLGGNSRDAIALLKKNTADLQTFLKLLSDHGNGTGSITPAGFGFLLCGYPDTENDTMDSALKKIFAQIKLEREERLQQEQQQQQQEQQQQQLEEQARARAAVEEEKRRQQREQERRQQPEQERLTQERERESQEVLEAERKAGEEHGLVMLKMGLKRANEGDLIAGVLMAGFLVVGTYGLQKDLNKAAEYLAKGLGWPGKITASDFTSSTANRWEVRNGKSEKVAERPIIVDSNGQVTSIVLRGRGLSGSLSPNIGYLGDLKYLDVAENNFSGTSIPDEICKLNKLRYLDLSYSKLEGSIPSQLGQLQALGYLHMESNDLSGSIPPQLGQLKSLHQLNLSYNNLTGSIPPQLGQLASLQILNLSNNKLTGSVPPELGQLKSLQMLSLENSKLSKIIPPEVRNMDCPYKWFGEENEMSWQ